MGRPVESTWGVPSALVAKSDENTYDVEDCELPPVRWLRNHSYPPLVSWRPPIFQNLVTLPVSCLLLRFSGSVASKYGALYRQAQLNDRIGESVMAVLVPPSPVNWKWRCEYCASTSMLSPITP